MEVVEKRRQFGYGQAFIWDPKAIAKIEQQRGKTREQIIFEHNPNAQIHTLTPTSAILEHEDDLGYLKGELKLYQRALSGILKYIQLVRMFRAAGVSETTIARDMYDRDDPVGVDLAIYQEMDPGRVNANRDFLLRTYTIGERESHFFDDPERDLLDDLLRDRVVTVDEHLNELVRIRRETTGLLGMQVNWLEAQRRTQSDKPRERGTRRKLSRKEKRDRRRTANKVNLPVSEDAQPVIVDVDTPSEAVTFQPFSLSDWEVYWSKRPWSVNTNHFVRVPNSSRDEMVDAVRTLGEDQVSIKPSSVVRALEHHLFNRDVIQQALATRNKYAPEGMRDWVKIKRGRDRIGILLPQAETSTVVFCVVGRDVAYRALER